MPGQRPAPHSTHRFSRGLAILCLLSAFSFGAIVKLAFGDSYHVTCVGHGFVSGADPNDGSFFAQVDAGCGTTYRHCALYTSGIQIGYVDGYFNTSCSMWSRSFGDFSECHSSAHVADPGAFNEHVHLPANWCG